MQLPSRNPKLKHDLSLKPELDVLRFVLISQGSQAIINASIKRKAQEFMLVNEALIKNNGSLEE